jgi:hypothetical protein
MEAQDKPQPRYVRDMTFAELKLMISREVERQLATRMSSKHRSPEALEAARQHLNAHRWSLPPGSPTVAELVRRERDR